MSIISDAAMHSDARYCERVTREHARTFSVASRFLPPHKRRGAYAVYAFCRLADDIVDRGAQGDREQLRRELTGYRNELYAALAGRPSRPVFRELMWAVRTFGIPRDTLFELLDGVATDLAPARYASWRDLTDYCEGVASSVGSMCTYVFGVNGGEAERERAVRYARILGVAMQHTNILRDVGEDAQRGRCYLPDDVLRPFGITPDDILHDATLASQPRWAAMMQHEVARARALYAAAAPGIALLAPDAQRCARACSDGYALILGALEGLQYDSLHTRARVGNWVRVGLMWNVWRMTPLSPTMCANETPTIVWRDQRIARADEMCA